MRCHGSLEFPSEHRENIWSSKAFRSLGAVYTQEYFICVKWDYKGDTSTKTSYKYCGTVLTCKLVI